MEYHKNFQDNISELEFNNKTKGIADWIEEHREKEEWAKDPNAYEMTNVFLFAGKYASEGKQVDLETVNKIWNLRMGDFENCGISENNFVYQICKKSYDSAMQKEALVNDENSHSALRKMAGIGLYLKQQKRDMGQNMDYDNPSELLELMENAKTLQKSHPDLYQSLRFEDNLRVLYELQQPHLDEKAKENFEAVMQEKQDTVGFYEDDSRQQ